VKYLVALKSMPKTRRERVARVLRQIKSGECSRVFEYHIDGVFCNVCASVLTSVTTWTLTSHLAKEKHKNNAKLKLSQTRITTTIEQQEQQPTSNFAYDLVETFISADIALHKLSDPKVQWLFETYAREKLPSVNCARTRLLKQIYDKKVLKMQESLEGHKLWVSNFKYMKFVPPCIPVRELHEISFASKYYVCISSQFLFGNARHSDIRLGLFLQATDDWYKIQSRKLHANNFKIILFSQIVDCVWNHFNLMPLN
jgi:hypothetical protein